MKKSTEELLDTSLAVLLCIGVFGAGIWKVARNHPKPAQPAEPKPRLVADPPLQSLSLSTPGDAPLDRIARMASIPVDQGPPDPEPLTPSVYPRTEDVLEHQSLTDIHLDHWSVPEPARLPIPTYAPAIMAFGIVLFAMGLATIWYVCVVGSIVFAIAAWRWTAELQGE